MTIKPKPFHWDPHSDQPYSITSKSYKRKRRLQSVGSMLYMFIISLLMMPIALLLQKLWKKPTIHPQNFFGMSVNFDKAPTETAAFVNELGVKKLLIRFRMDQMERIKDFKLWLGNFSNQEITLNIIQDPNLAHKDLEKTFKTIFTHFFPLVKRYQIGTTLNRSKWGFYSVNEYLRFFRIAHKIKKAFVGIELFGPSVIDFEYYYTTQALFNPALLSFDACSALLYVDRTVTPENKQFGFNLLAKINLLYSLVKLSPKSKNRIIITETNWPIIDSGKYAPTSDLECVTQEEFANYLIRYYLLALGSSKVETVYWHQLIAVGFGLINPNKNLEKRAAFYAFKTMMEQLASAHNIKLIVHKTYYELSYSHSKYSASVLWTNNTEISYPLENKASYITRDGKPMQTQNLIITASPIYLIHKESS